MTLHDPSPVLAVRGLEVAFRASGRAVSVVRGVDVDVHANEVLGIVGESGSGKSVTALAIAGLLPPTAAVRGSIRLGDIEVTKADRETLRRMRGRDLDIIGGPSRSRLHVRMSTTLRQPKNGLPQPIQDPLRFSRFLTGFHLRRVLYPARCRRSLTSAPSTSVGV